MDQHRVEAIVASYKDRTLSVVDICRKHRVGMNEVYIALHLWHSQTGEFLFRSSGSHLSGHASAVRVGTIRKPGWEARDARDAEIVRAYTSGEGTVEQIASKMDISPSMVYRVLHMKGIPLRSRKQRAVMPTKRNPIPNGDRDKEIFRLFLEQDTPAEVLADMFGVSRQRIYQIINRVIAKTDAKEVVKRNGRYRVTRYRPREEEDTHVNH